MTDCRLASKLVVNVTSCKVLQSDAKARWDVREQVTRGGLFFPPIHNVFRSDYQPYSQIRFHRLSGDLKIEEGEWRLEPLDGGAADAGDLCQSRRREPLRPRLHGPRRHQEGYAQGAHEPAAGKPCRDKGAADLQ